MTYRFYLLIISKQMFPSLDCWVLYVAYRAFLEFKLLPFSLVWKRHAPLSLPHVKRKTNINHALLSHLYVPALHAGQVLKKAWARKVWCTVGCKENKILGSKALNCNVPAWKSFSLTLKKFISCRASMFEFLQRTSQGTLLAHTLRRVINRVH